jgi:hypothetical protein
MTTSLAAAARVDDLDGVTWLKLDLWIGGLAMVHVGFIDPPYIQVHMQRVPKPLWSVGITWISRPSSALAVHLTMPSPHTTEPMVQLLCQVTRVWA